MHHVVYPATRLDWVTVATAMMKPAAKMLVTVVLMGAKNQERGRP
jgi:hypothetical protein